MISSSKRWFLFTSLIIFNHRPKIFRARLLFPLPSFPSAFGLCFPLPADSAKQTSLFELVTVIIDVSIVESASSIKQPPNYGSVVESVHRSSRLYTSTLTWRNSPGINARYRKIEPRGYGTISWKISRFFRADVTFEGRLSQVCQKKSSATYFSTKFRLLETLKRRISSSPPLENIKIIILSSRNTTHSFSILKSGKRNILSARNSKMFLSKLSSPTKLILISRRRDENDLSQNLSPLLPWKNEILEKR